MSGLFVSFALADPPAAARVETKSHHNETRLETLQHYRLAGELLEMEQRKLQDLEKHNEAQFDALVKATFRERLGKELQPTWDRLNDGLLNFQWDAKVQALPAEKQAEIREVETKSVTIVNKELDSYKQAMQDRESEVSKTLAKKYHDLPATEESRMEHHLVRILARERDETRAALLRD